jgi:hypothetical protein
MDTIRTIVLAVRDATGTVSEVDGIAHDQFVMHAQLLMEAGLVEGDVLGGSRRLPQDAAIFRLTWAGHDFADAVRDDTLWNKAKGVVLKPAASWTFNALLDFLKAEIARQTIGI